MQYAIRVIFDNGNNHRFFIEAETLEEANTDFFNRVHREEDINLKFPAWGQIKRMELKEGRKVLSWSLLKRANKEYHED